MSARRGHGDGSLHQRHDHATCPPLIDGQRAHHRCQGRWVGVIDLGWSGGKRHRKTVLAKTRAEASRKLNQAKAQLHANQLVLNAPTVNAWFAYWLEEIAAPRVKANTLPDYRAKVRLYIGPHIGHHRIDRLEPQHVRGMYTAMRKQGLAEATLRKTHAILRRGLKDAMRDGKVARNVADLVDAPSMKVNKRTPLTVEQARQVLATAKGTPLESRWMAALWLGLRQSEALGLRWGNVDLDNAVIHINDTIWGTPKSQASNRTIQMPPMVAASMRRRWVDYLHEREQPGYDDHARVWCQTKTGKQLDPAKDYHNWRDLLVAAGVPHVALHAARNTAASLLMAAGEGVRVVSDILGHGQVQITQNTYQQGNPQMYRDAMLALEAYLNPPPTSAP